MARQPAFPPAKSELRHTITFKVVTETRNDDGSITETPAGTATRKARILSESANEVETEDSRMGIGEVEMVFRYYSSLTSKTQITFSGRTFNVIAVDNWRQRNQWHIVRCKELV